MDVFDENDEFGIHLHMANECLCLLDVDEFKQNGFGIWMSFCMSFQHEQPACLKPNCMFYFWKLPHVFEMVFDVFEVFATSANETGNGYGTVGMNSHVNSSWTVAFLLVEKDAWLASCRCLLPEGTARQEEAQYSMLLVDCM